ncbi:hypothetical protein [Exiguobacterium sp. s168]|uniref:hypothetical protein n=1 Tax=Exiguobacterium sp. s168 TaxID=2751194 RepID=UPI001BE98443|nr:hypothetical protein [Exiguobacterium sp. s168]
MAVYIQTSDGEKYRLDTKQSIETISGEIQQDDSKYISVSVEVGGNKIKMNIFKEHIVTIFDMPDSEPSIRELG